MVDLFVFFIAIIVLVCVLMWFNLHIRTSNAAKFATYILMWLGIAGAIFVLGAMFKRAF